MTALQFPLLLLFLLSALMGVCALALIRVRHLFTVIVLLSAYSAFQAAIFALLGAVDVAFTEAVVGVSISTVFMMMLARQMSAEDKALPRGQNLAMGLAAALAVGVVFAYGIDALPDFGEGDAPIHTHVAEFYIANSYSDTHTPNVVTAVLADYRGFDTLIETAVVLTAAAVCLLILGETRRGEARQP